MANPWIPDEDKSEHLTMERITLSSLRQAANDPANQLDQFSDLLQNNSLSAEEALEKAAERLELAGQYDEAMAILPHDLIRRQDSIAPAVLARLWYRYASLNRWTGNIPRAIWCATNGLQLYAELKDTAGVGTTHALLGYCYWMIDEYAIAYDHLVAAWKCQETLDDGRALAQTAWNLSVVNHLEGRLDEARDNCRKGLELLQKLQPLTLNDHLVLGKLRNTLALVDAEEGHNQQAVQNCKQALEHWSQSKDGGLMAMGYANLAGAQLAIGTWRQAEESLRLAQTLIQDQNRHTECMVLTILSALHLRQGKFVEAERSARRAVELAMESGLKAAEGSGWESLGEILLAQGRAEEAITQFRHSLRIFTKLGRRVDLPGLYLRLSEAHLERAQSDTAFDCLLKAQELLKDQPKLHLNALTARLKGRLHIVRNELSQGITSLAQSISLFESISHPYEAACGHLEIGLALAGTDPGRAVSHLETATRVFTELKAEPKLNKARELLASLRETLAPSRRSASALTIDDVVVIERLNAASGSHELLLRELAAILHNQLQQDVVIFEHIQADHSFKPVVIHGFSDREVEKAARTLRTCLETGKKVPDGILLKALTDTSHTVGADLQRNFWVFLQGDDSGLPPQFGALDALMRISNMSLELCRLRSLTQSMRKTVSQFVTGSYVTIAGMFCESPSMQQVLSQIQKIRSSDATVLITGESGVGKELVARAIHQTSTRHSRLFLPFNCASIPAELVESRLFGHTKGAFTGADKDTIGVIRAASGGTLFLDEIGELTLSVQPKLLRFLQEREIHALGDNQPIRVDVRVLAATNRSLAEEAERGHFREDLYHRLNVIRIHVPPLRERPEDIPLLARYLLTEAAKKENKSVVFSEAALDVLRSYSWPGNVRQLKNELERAVVMADQETVLMPEDLSSEIWQTKPGAPGTLRRPETRSAQSPPRTLAQAIEEVERRVISETLKRHSGNISRVARELDISRNGLMLKCKRLGLEWHD